MRIRWDEESWQSIMQQLRHAQLGLKDVLDAASADRNALEEMNPAHEDRALCRIEDRYHTVCRKMHRTEQELSDLIQAMRRAEHCFNDAEEEIKRDLNNLNGGNGSGKRGTGDAGFTSQKGWVAPQVLLLETLYSSKTEVIVPDWLTRLIEQNWNIQ